MMKGFNHRYLAAIFLVIAISFLIYYLPAKSISTAEGSEKSPQFEVDPFWPKPLPNN